MLIQDKFEKYRMQYNKLKKMIDNKKKKTQNINKRSYLPYTILVHPKQYYSMTVKMNRDALLQSFVSHNK